jgi:hypothetical protein
VGLSDNRVKEICRIGQGGGTCAFLSFDPNTGFFCAKGTGLERVIFMRLAHGESRSKGDNCAGPPNFKLHDIRVDEPRN